MLYPFSEIFWTVPILEQKSVPDWWRSGELEPTTATARRTRYIFAMDISKDTPCTP